MSVRDEAVLQKDVDACVQAGKPEDEGLPVPSSRKKRLLAATSCVLGECRSARPIEGSRERSVHLNTPHKPFTGWSITPATAEKLTALFSATQAPSYASEWRSVSSVP